MTDKTSTNFKLGVMLRGDLEDVHRLYGTTSYATKEQCEVRLMGVAIGLAENMSWSLGPDITRPNISGMGGVEMYRFGVCLFSEVQLFDHVRENLKVKLPDVIQYMIIDYYSGIIITVQNGQIIWEEAIPVMMAKPTVQD